ncbi:hypothetical protein GOB57_10285 [Sinorhizobium meliloti]|nr:hypothetical protein [Sinorhizobium meliloti]
MCALTATGGVKCWGDNAQKQIGGLSLKYSTPQTVLASGVRQVAGGGAHTCAVKTDGTVWCWGRNADGQIGTGSASSASVATPSKVIGLPAGMVSVTAGGNHSCAIDGDGKGWCWGKNDKGQLGNETMASSAVPVRVASP